MLRTIKAYCTPLPFLLLCVYTFLMYNAQETLLSPAIHSASMYLMIAVSLVYYGFKLQLKPSVFTYWYASFLVLCLISASIFLESDEWILYDMLVSLIISYCVILNLTNETKIRCLANIYILSAIVMGIQLWATGQLDYLFMLSQFGPESRLGAEVTGNANIFSALFMYAGVFASWLIVYTPRNVKKLLYVLLLGAILFLMAVSGGRKTIVAVVATLAMFFFFKRDSKHRTHYGRNFAVSVLIIVGIFFAIFNIPFLYGVVGERFEGMFEMFGGGGAVVVGDDMRDWMIGRAFNGWLEAPFFGHGIDSFKYYNQIETGHHFYAHNNILELLFDVGIVGFAVYYWIFYYLLKKLFQLPAQLYAYRVLGYGLLFEIFIFDFGGISYYLVGSIIILAICFCCSRLKASRL